jgi:polyisoprenoid-binding protein YceI
MVTKVRGAFNDISGHGYFDAAQPAQSKVELSIQAASIDTRNADRDAHLRSNDFFAMEQYPTITFTSTGVEVVGSETFELTGDLTIKGVTKPVTLDVEYLGTETDPWGGTRAGFEGTTQISRKAWGVDFNIPMDGGRLLVGDKIDITVAVQAVLQQEQ